MPKYYTKGVECSSIFEGCMFGVSLPEIIVIMVIVLIVFGPDKLPEIARHIGKFSGDLRRNTDAIRREFYNTVYTPADDLKRSLNRELTGLTTEVRAPPPPPAPLTPPTASPTTTEPETNGTSDEKHPK